MSGHIQREFEGFLKAAYFDPQSLHADQVRQLRDAFFGGALIAHTTPNDLIPELYVHLGEVKERADRVEGRRQADA